MGRRGAKEGAVYQDTTTGLWCGALSVTGPDGRRRRKVVRSKSKDTVLAKLRAVQTRVDAGQNVLDDRATVATWLRYWLDEIAPGGTANPASIKTYRERLEVRVVPYIGDVQLSKLGPIHVQRMIRALEAKGLAPASIVAARTTLKQALDVAAAWGKMPQGNPVRLVRPPKSSGPRLDDALDADQAAKVLETAKGDRWEALAVLVLTTGLRQGEALALTWDDIDLKAGTVSVRRSKTTSGVRTIALPAMTVEALQAHRARQRKARLAAPVWASTQLVFTTSVGTQILRRDALRWWHEMTVEAGLGRRRFHASRHTAATLMLNNGVPLEVVSATLGHAGLAITADVYAKVRPELQRTAATAMQTVLGGGGR